MQVRFDDISMKFGNKLVLNHINFTLPSHHLISFLGPSGCGKSTTLYLISGLLNPSSGKIFFDEKDVTSSDPVKRGVGLVFQNYALYPHMTVKENILFPLKMAKMDRKTRHQRTEEMAELTRIADQLDKYPRQLSGGQQQRVAISRALAKEPKILLMDEPLSNLDARLRIEMREEIRRIQQETGITTVFVTHDQEEALSIADQVMVLEAGHIQQISDPISLYQKPNNQFVARFIGSPVINMINRNSQALNSNHPILQIEWENLGVRSEDFMVGNQNYYLVEAQIERVNIVGKDITVTCSNGKEQFIVSDIDPQFNEGDKLYLDVNPEKIHLFNEVGKRLDNTLGDLDE
ncbi:ABC transporter ATP-binding protein [Facklamia sp. DSM 111018]|uniref:ABC transporter ATP-binding protein n=1 Tax=Facklamia lactis TaxID=2749967 RepID=A0ABS0LTY3_9LACT|nr:ABC transporter ATP-binding protein [Facklamia lactis]MBG9980801.1 ABC transporter ATP-binding protein [Facklamia lactis]MBG9986836.1 ABC transporter ATP-binding protein [Facklamia lactis]